MGCGRILLAILLPPLAVLDKGCGAVLVVLILTIVGWIPGVIGALVIGSISNSRCGLDIQKVQPVRGRFGCQM